ncbi:hypothetical protein HK101_007399, partial [Irineochytrium annulatum]
MPSSTLVTNCPNLATTTSISATSTLAALPLVDPLSSLSPASTGILDGTNATDFGTAAAASAASSDGAHNLSTAQILIITSSIIAGLAALIIIALFFCIYLRRRQQRLAMEKEAFEDRPAAAGPLDAGPRTSDSPPSSSDSEKGFLQQDPLSSLHHPPIVTHGTHSRAGTSGTTGTNGTSGTTLTQQEWDPRRVGKSQPVQKVRSLDPVPGTAPADPAFFAVLTRRVAEAEGHKSEAGLGGDGGVDQDTRPLSKMDSAIGITPHASISIDHGGVDDIQP